AAQVVPHQVDDHHVLGVVLLQQVGRCLTGAFDRTGLDHVAVPGQVQLGGGGHDGDAGQVEGGGVGGGVARGQPQREGGGVGFVPGGEGGGQHPAQVGLVDLAPGDVVADAPHARLVGGAVQGGRPRVGVGSAPGGGRPGQGCGTHVVEAGAHGFALVVDDDRPPA